MNWLTNFVRPKVRDALKKRDTPENLWHKCKSCGQMIFHKEFKEALSVCSACGHHERIPSLERFAQLFDEGVYTRVKVPKAIEDPLKFKDQKKYSDRLKQ